MSLSTGKIFWLAAITLVFVFLLPQNALAACKSDSECQSGTVCLNGECAPELKSLDTVEYKNKASYFGIKPIAEKGGLTSNAVSKSGSVPALIGNIVGVALSFVGAAFFILILYAGILWMTAAGNAERVESAKKILIAAAIGLIIVLSAYAITRFVFSGLGVAGGGGAKGSVTAGGEDSGGGGRGYATCDGANDGEICGDTYVCYYGQCVSKCEVEYGDKRGECVRPGSCSYQETSGLCPHGDICCYAQFE